MTQWHPLFAQLLRPVLESHYDIRTNMPVGDVPREADAVLLRRMSAGPPPFTGLWRWLTPWNILEFKGPSVSARVDDLDALLELGLGIERRLQTAQTKVRVARADVSLWYLANHLGRRFLAKARGLVGPMELLADGVWRARVWQRSLLLVSNREVAIERDSLPVHMLTAEPLPQLRELVHVLAGQPELWQPYGSTLSWLHPDLVKEMHAMARSKTKGLHPDVRPLIKWLGWQEVVRQTGLRGLVDEVGVASLFEAFTPEELDELFRLRSQVSTARKPKRSPE